MVCKAFNTVSRPVCFILFFLQLGVALTTSAQQSYLKIKFENLSVNEGLSNSRVTCIVQDRKGYLWVGTDDGLNKFDGYTFRNYRGTPGDTTSFFNNTIKSVYEDSTGTLWTSTDGRGLYTYDSKYDRFRSVKEFSRRCIIEKVRESQDGDLWVSGNFDGNAATARLNRKTSGWEIFYILRSTLPVSDIQQISDSLYWVSIKNLGLFKWNRFTNTLGDNISRREKMDTRVQKIKSDVYGNTWFATANGLYKLPPGQKDFVAFKAGSKSPGGSLPVNAILDIMPDGKNLWVGTENGGVCRLNILTNEISTFATDKNNPFSIRDNSVWVVYKDHQDRVWAGTFSKGLCVYDELKYKFHELDVELENDIVNAILKDHRNRLWIGTEGGLVMKDGRNTRIFKHNPHRPTSIQNNAVLSLFQDSRKNIWVGTWDGGLSRYNESSDDFTRFEGLADEDFSYYNTNVFSIREQSATKNLLVAGYQGLRVLEDERFTKYVDAAYLDNNYLTAVCEDHEGNIWLGSHLQLNKLDHLTGERSRFYFEPSTGAGIFVNCILEDSKDRLWVGSNQGLKLLVDGKPRGAYTMANGLPSDVIRSITEDTRGNLWLGTSQGISMFDPGSHEFTNYSVNDGLLSNDFKKNSVFQASDGRVFFGGKGVNVFYPDSVRINKHVPSVFITDLKLFNKSVPIGGTPDILSEHISGTREIFLDHDNTVITLDFVALNFTASNKNRFAYILKGFDKDWNDSGGSRSATYTNIDPGTYTFVVKASNNDGVWNHAGASLIIHVRPPWWETWWFRFTAAASGITAAVMLFRLRTQRIRATNRKLGLLVHNKTKEVLAQHEQLSRSQVELANQNIRLQASEEELTQNLEQLKAIQDVLEERNGIIEAKERQLRQIFNAVPAMIFQFKRTTDGWFSFPAVSHGSTAIFGLGPEVLTRSAMVVLRKIHPDDLVTYMPTFEESIENPNKEVHVELRVFVDDRIRWIKISTIPEKLEDQSTLWSGIILDITERKTAENELNRTREMLEQTNQLARVGGWEFDMITQKVTWSEITREISEVSPDFEPDLMSGIKFYKEGESRENISNAIHRIKTDGKPFDVTSQVITARGNERWIRTLGQAEFRKGKCIRLYGAVQDIDNQVKAGLLLAESENNFRQINETIEDVFWLYDCVNQKYIYVSPSCEKVWGLSQRSLYDGVPFIGSVHEDDRLHVSAAIDTLSKSLSYDIEYRIITNEGGIKWMHERSFAICDERGNYTRNSGICRDITEKKQAEKDLERKNLELVMSRDEIKIQNNRLREQSDELAAQNEELVQNGEEIASQRDLLSAQFSKLQEAQTTIEDQNKEIRSRNENLEAEVARRTKEILDYNHQLEQFAFISAHNLRAPVARILGLGQILELPSLHVSEKQNIIDRLVGTTIELDTVVKDLNKILEIRKDSQQPLTEVSIYEMLKLTEATLQHEIEESHTRISSDFSRAEIVRTVRPYLQSIIYNLVSNAIKYRHPRRDPQLTISSDVAGNFICITVSDNGMGIDLEQYKEKIFSLYKRFHFHTEGKGLGLYLVKNQIDSLGGRIEVESRVDEGSTFRVYFRN